jgi:hypothetical protein
MFSDTSLLTYQFIRESGSVRFKTSQRVAKATRQLLERLRDFPNGERLCRLAGEGLAGKGLAISVSNSGK